MTDQPDLSALFLPPASGGSPESIVVLLHGYGSNAEDLMGLAPYWRDALPDTAFLSANAPQDVPGLPGGRQWWGFADRSPEARGKGVRDAASILNRFLDAVLAQEGLSDDRLALVGFSQGTMMALHVGVRRERRLAGIVGFSGRLLEPESLAAEMVTKPPVLLVHGDADAMVPPSSLPEAAETLTALGFEVETHISPGLGHSIDEAGLRLGGQFLQRVLG